jgi:ribokinase
MTAQSSAPILCVVGSVNLDTFVSTPRLPAPGETVLGHSQTHTPGGKGANQAVAAALMGASVSFIGAVGRDAAGETVRQVLQEKGLDVQCLARVDGATGSAIVCVGQDGENAIIVISGANRAFGPDEVRMGEGLIRGADAVILQGEISLASTREAIKAATSAGTPIIWNLAPMATDVREVLPLIAACEVLIVNEGEEAVLLAAGAKVHTLGPQLVITTRGARGVRWWHQGSEGELAAIEPSAPIIDTVGAGDAFVGAFTARWASARVSGTPLDETGLRDMMRWGMAAGALACTKRGAIEALPSRSEVVTLLKR